MQSSKKTQRKEIPFYQRGLPWFLKLRGLLYLVVSCLTLFFKRLNTLNKVMTAWHESLENAYTRI